MENKPLTKFGAEVRERILRNFRNCALVESAQKFVSESTLPKYSYNFEWLGRPIIQYPQDIVAMQEIIWQVRPDLIIETGIAHGGSLVFSASMLALVDVCEGIGQKKSIDLSRSRRSSRRRYRYSIPQSYGDRGAPHGLAHPNAARLKHRSRGN